MADQSDSDYDYGYCFGCTEPMGPVDDDPNGAHNATCAKCRAEEDHDWDAEPDAKFNRDGSQVDPDHKPGKGFEVKNSRDGYLLYEDGLRVDMGNHLTAYRIADLLNKGSRLEAAVKATRRKK